MQIDLDVADGRPVVLVEMFLDQLGEGVGELHLPGGEALVVVHAQGDAVAVGRVHEAVAHHGTLVGGLPLQRVADLDGLDLALEHPGEGRTDDSLKAALEPLRQAHQVSFCV